MSNKNFKIFDSLSHPVLDESYNPQGRDYSFIGLQKSMQESSIKWACAVGLSGKGGYEHKAYIDKCNAFPHLYPIAGFNPSKANPNIDSELKLIKELGFVAIKIHPGICNLDINAKEVFKTFELCAQLKLPIFLCSYYFTSSVNSNFYEKLCNLVTEFPATKLNIVHGGGVEVLKFAELVRSNKSLLLDLSFTMLKYSGSSIDQDIKFLFENFDRRICIGTDHPEFSPLQLENKMIQLTQNLNQEKIDNICYKNLAEFLGLELKL